jgi:hypothetical protein
MSSVDQSLSLMIPRVFPKWIDEQKIIDIFHQQQLGRVYKVSIIRVPDSKKRSIPIYQAFIYFSAWYENTIAYNFQQRIYGPKAQARVVYDDPWYWVVFENTKRRLSNNDKRIMRLGYQAYLQEQAAAEQEQRIRYLEDMLQKFPAVPTSEAASEAVTSEAVTSEAVTSEAVTSEAATSEAHLSWNNLSESFAMDTLGQELNLTETALSVAEAALYEETPMDISFNSAETGNVPSWLSYQQTQLEAAAAELLGEEMALTETAMSVAEAALEPMDLSDDDDYYSDASSYDGQDHYYNW